jgi:hypothetical protein
MTILGFLTDPAGLAWLAFAGIVIWSRWPWLRRHYRHWRRHREWVRS